MGGSRRRYLAIVFIMLVAGLSCSPQILEGYGGISSRVDFTDDFGATWNDEWLDYHMGFECHIGDLSAGMRAIHDEDRFEKTVLLDAWGWLGPVWFTSMAHLGPRGPHSDPDLDLPWGLHSARTIAGSTFAGLEFFGFAQSGKMVWEDEWHDIFWSCIGLRANIGQAHLGVLLSFGASVYHVTSRHFIMQNAARITPILPADPSIPACYTYDPNDRFPFAFEVGNDWQIGWGVLWSYPPDLSCGPRFTNADIDLYMPYGCIDLAIKAALNCDVGFQYGTLELRHVPLGISWLELDPVYITATLERTNVSASFSFPGLSGLCLEPTFVLPHDSILDSIELAALNASWRSSGVTIKAGHSFNELEHPEMFDRTGQRSPWYPYQPLLVNECTEGFYDAMSLYDGYIGLDVDGSQCCGIAFTLSVMSWFDAGDDNFTAEILATELGETGAGLFDWEETELRLAIAITSNTVIELGASIRNEGLAWLELSADFATPGLVSTP